MKTLWICLHLLTLYSCFPGSESGNEQFIAPETHQCACSNTVLTFECTTDGSGITLWNGTAFNCENGDNQIRLLNGAFSSGSAGSSGKCSDNIVARGIKVDGRCHTSQLNVTITSDSGLNQSSIVCHSCSSQDRRLSINVVGSAVLTILLNQYPPPRNLMSTNASPEKITFTWNSMAPSCSSMESIHYLITASNCGVCPQTVSNTTATCTNLQPTTEIHECRFSVQNVVCGVMGNPSETATERIGVPTISKLAVVPRFMSNRTLLSLEGFCDSTLAVPVNVTAYKVSFLSPSGAILSSKSIYPALDPNCAVDVLFLCPPLSSESVKLNVHVLAVNSFGQGPSSSINKNIGCTNNFVTVDYSVTSSTFSCKFLMNEMSEKSCNISFSICQDAMTKSISNSSNTSNLITLSLDNQNLKPGIYCYQAEASSDSFSVIVNGSWSILSAQTETEETSMGTSIALSTIGAIAAVVIIIITIAIVIFLISHAHIRRKKEAEPKKIIIHVNGSYVTLIQKRRAADPEIKSFDVGSSNTSLRQCVESNIGRFQRGCAFYEFTHEMECISEDEELIFMNHDIDNLFTPQLDREARNRVGICGEQVARPEIGSQSFRLFVQSMGSGKRHVSPGSCILYKVIQDSRKNKQPAVEMPRSNMSIISWKDLFVTETIKTSGILKGKHKLKANNYVFLNVSVAPSLIPRVKDVIIQINENEKVRAETGPSARNIVKDIERSPDHETFVYFSELTGVKFNEDTRIMYQNPTQKSSFFHVLKVDADQENVQMLEFIKQKLKIGGNKFVNGNAFYEFNETEDLLYYKEVLHVPNEPELVVGKLIELQSDIGYFYEIPGTPGVDIAPPQRKDYRLFLQSTSQGSRCLKANSLLLYKYEGEYRDVSPKDGHPSLTW